MYMLSAFAPATMSAVPSSVERTVPAESGTGGTGVPARCERNRPPAAVIITIRVMRGLHNVTMNRTSA